VCCGACGDHSVIVSKLLIAAGIEIHLLQHASSAEGDEAVLLLATGEDPQAFDELAIERSIRALVCMAFCNLQVRFLHRRTDQGEELLGALREGARERRVELRDLFTEVIGKFIDPAGNIRPLRSERSISEIGV
jgi:hypothetical protein